MSALETFLINLRNKVFKLLPMREAHDNGEENHLSEYIERLCANYAGAFDCYPELASVAEVVEVYGSIAFLKDNLDIDFNEWRAMILRSTRLVQTAAERHTRGV